MLARSSAMYTRSMSTNPSHRYIQRVKDSFQWTFVHSSQAERGGDALYEAAVDKVDHALWFKRFALPDTFVSWFAITELHAWMCAQRVMDDGFSRRGQGARDNLIKNMWTDCETRMKKLGPMASKKRQDGLFELADHFKLMMFVYDEGLNKDDQLLAAALWRGLFHRDEKFTEFHHLRTLVHYVRSNVDHLDKVPIGKLYEFDGFTWKPLEESIKATSGGALNQVT
ncbi:ubiquinol-cytochrome-c reductase complex assembly factor 1 [Galendromus occidentalis]|uniref:Ubiquinol-cytochrome-c reductase complex assembly factor 1 n=1 Tax=Galendromus occidentalis TaxID=34638 RepID=A0AAJ6VXT6_9ACAR|nr:ubiquinol-cytochrome-c reductase complex assembly factor 1 [Galendromus occidentalis]